MRDSGRDGAGCGEWSVSLFDSTVPAGAPKESMDGFFFFFFYVVLLTVSTENRLPSYGLGESKAGSMWELTEPRQDFLFFLFSLSPLSCFL